MRFYQSLSTERERKRLAPYAGTVDTHGEHGCCCVFITFSNKSINNFIIWDFDLLFCRDPHSSSLNLTLHQTDAGPHTQYTRLPLAFARRNIVGDRVDVFNVLALGNHRQRHKGTTARTEERLIWRDVNIIYVCCVFDQFIRWKSASLIDVCSIYHSAPSLFLNFVFSLISFAFSAAHSSRFGASICNENAMLLRCSGSKTMAWV